MSEKVEHDNQQLISKGVDELIERLRLDGVEAGQSQAAKIVEDAELQAKKILQDAQDKSQKMLTDAAKQADNYQKAAENAIQTAMRDMVLELKSDLAREFGDDVKRLIANQTLQPEFLQKIILEIVGRVTESAGIDGSEAPIVILPDEVVGLEQLRNDPGALAESPLTDLVLDLTSDMLKKGVRFGTSSEVSAGLHIQLNDQNLEIDLSAEAISELLLAHLQPRFRAILEGVVR